MPTTFSAATCLTFNPTVQPSTGPFDIYLDSDYTSTPIVTGVDITLLTGNSCPYIIEVPDGTTNLGIKDTIKDYCITIPVQNNDICSNCNLSFSNYSPQTISKLYCGYLIGTCEYDDYLINWYGPNDTTTLSFQSGAGIFVTSGVYSHPLTGINSIPRENGVYTPVISKIKLSGITFSNTGGTGNVLFSGSCLPSTNILPLTCDVKTNTDTSLSFSAFTNFINFKASTSIPQPVQTTYQISANTKYIVWAFQGFNYSDRILLEFSGSSYGTTKIGIDDFIIGYLDVPSSNFTPSLYPKSGRTNENFVKFSCLTGLTVTNGDKIIITVTPLSPDTNWSLYMSCLDDYNCNDCLNTSQPYKIISSSITTSLQPCDRIKIDFSVSGCNTYDQNSDFLVYNLGNTLSRPTYYSNSNTPNNYIQPPSSNMYFSSNSCYSTSSNISTSCLWDLITGTTYNKTFLTDGSNRGVFGFTGSSTFISTYYNSIRNAFFGLTPYSSTWSGSTNSSDLSYYRYYNLKIPTETVGISSCQDNNTFINLFIHHTSTYTTGTTGDNYYLHITANTISKNINYTNCDLNCTYIQDNINHINNTSTGSTYGTNRPFPFPWGMYYTNPVHTVAYITSASTSSAPTSVRRGFFTTPYWTFNTYPFSGNPSTIIPSYSGSVCNYNNTGVKSTQYNTFSTDQYKFYYDVRLINSSNISDFEIWASPITNLSYSGAPGTVLYELAYRYSGGSTTYSNPTYII